jgi:hypothetical protein
MPLIGDLQLTITPSTALYTNPIPDSAISVNESSVEGRKAIILDFNNSEGIYARDMGTIFQWPTNASTVLDIWQPSIAPMDGEIYDRLSYHCMMTSLAGEGWQHIREMNIAHASTSDLFVLLTFDQWPPLTIQIPNSGGLTRKDKVTVPVNKWKMVEIFIYSAQPFKMWTNDLECKTKNWGSAEGYRLLRPVSG